MPCRRRRGNTPGRVVGMVAAGELHDVFREERRLLERQPGLVGEDIVDEVGPGRSRISEIADLDGCRATSKDPRPTAARQPVQSDGDVYLKIFQQSGDAGVAV